MNHTEEQMTLTTYNARLEFEQQGVDPRYTVDFCWCGVMIQRYMVRFCGEHIGNYDSVQEAVQKAKQHNATRLI